jgi:hypothetical protein
MGQTVGLQSSHPPASKAGNEYVNYAAIPRGNGLQTHNIRGNLVNASEILRGHCKMKLYFSRTKMI